jgi:ribosome-binding protein aMBF1 (putative translation factor)
MEDSAGRAGDAGRAGEELPILPGFREIAQRRRRVIGELAGARRAAGLSQTEVAARMGTSQSVVARLESGQIDARLSTLQRYAAAVGRDLELGIGGAAQGPQEGSS